MRSVSVCLAIAVVGCGGDLDLDKINQLVASKHVQKLRFVKTEFVGNAAYQRPFQYTLAVPQQWTGSGGSFKPRDTASGDALMGIESSCDMFDALRKEREEAPSRPLDDHEKGQSQTCFLGRESLVRNWTDEDWYKAIDAAHTHWGVVPVLRDERSGGRRIVLTGDAQRQELHVFWWRKGAPEYFECSVSLGPELIESMAAFEQACKSVVVRGP